MRALDWRPSGPDSAGTRLLIGEHASLVVYTADQAGISGLTGHGHLRLPAPLRHRCGIGAGDRVLLVADPPVSRLVVHPALQLDAMGEGRHAQLLGGEPR